MPKNQTPKILVALTSTQVEDIYGEAVERWTDAVLEGDISPLSYNEAGLKDEDEVLERTKFYVGHVYGRLGIFASSTDGVTPSKSDFRYDQDDGWQSL